MLANPPLWAVWAHQILIDKSKTTQIFGTQAADFDTLDTFDNIVRCWHWAIEINMATSSARRPPPPGHSMISSELQF